MEVAGHTLFGAAPFPKSTWIDVKGSSIYVGTANTMEVSVLNPEGMVETVFRYPEADLAVRQEDRDWYVDRMTEMASTPQEEQMLGPLLGALVFPGNPCSLQRFETGRCRFDLAPYLAAISLLIHPPTSGRCFRTRECCLARCPLPERFEVLEFGSDYILGVWKDEMDVEFVRLYSLEGGAEN